MRWPWSSKGTQDPPERLASLAAALAPDPPTVWPEVPQAPVSPGHGWQARRLDATGVSVWWQPVPPGAAAVESWTWYRGQYGRTGLWPVLVGNDFWEAVELGPVQGMPEPGGGRDLIVGRLQLDGVDEGVMRGPVPTVVTSSQQEGQSLLEGVCADVDTLVLVPARADWLVPELLAWDGAVNADVLGPEHTAVLGRWSGLYGTELLSLTRDTLALTVTRPPRRPRQRLLAAVEAFSYCDDAVNQGVGTLEALVAMTAAPVWQFWWD